MASCVSALPSEFLPQTVPGQSGCECEDGGQGRSWA